MESIRLKFKKAMATAVSVVMVASMLPVGASPVYAAAKSVKVKLTVAVKGELAKDKSKKLMVEREVKATDLNKDNKVSLDEVLVAAHKKYNSKDGYAAKEQEFMGVKSKMVTKLWGVDSTANGFYRNNNMTAAVDQEFVDNNDNIVAFVYKDQQYYSDLYSFFEDAPKTAKTNNEVTFTLKALTWNADYTAMEVKPLALATVKATDGTVLGTTGTDGKATVKFPKKGTYTVTAEGNGGLIIAPPAAVVKVTDQKATGVTIDGQKSSTRNVEIGGEFVVTAAVAPATASFQDIEWKSSNDKLATVKKLNDTQATIKVTATKAAKVTITAKVKGKSAKLKLNIGYKAIDANASVINCVEVNGHAMGLINDVKGKTEIYEVKDTAKYAVIAAPQGTDPNFTWTSSDPKKVTVGKTNGKITVKAPTNNGNVKITVKQKNTGVEVGSFYIFAGLRN